MPSPQQNVTNIPSNRVEIIDSRTGLVSREWYRFFLNIFNLAGSGGNQTSLDDLQIGPPPQPATASGGSGTVTSVDVSGGTTGLTTSGGPVTSSGTITIAGTLNVANGGTGATTAINARSNLSAAQSGANTDITSIALTSGTVTTAPSSSSDLVNKSYADSIASGVNFHAACNYATTTALASNTYNNGASGVGATLTAVAVGTLTIDGYTFVVGDVGKRILVKDEVTGANNGIYTLTQAGTVLLPYILTRATDYDTSGSGTNEIDQGDLVLVLAGTTNANTSWVQQTPLPITVGTTALVFIQFAAVQTYTAGTGLSLVTNQFSITNIGTANTYGSATAIPVFVTNAQGQVTSVTNTTATPAVGSITGFGTGVATFLATPTSANLATAVTDETGSGSLVFATSPTLVTPILGTPQSGNFSTGTFTWPTFNQNTTGTASNVTGIVAVANGGSGQITAQLAINAFAGAVTSGSYLRGNGTNVVMSTIQAADVPTLNQNTTGTASNVTGTVAVANGGTGLATTPANGALDIGNGTGFTRSTLTAGSGISVTNAAGAITIANTSPSSGGTVTSVAALTLGTIGTDLSSSVANSTTTPVITLNVPTASATNRGVLSSADWTTFNNKGSGTVTSVTGTSPVVSSGGTTPAISLATAYGDTLNPYASKTANFFLAAPNGLVGVPTFRAVVAADIPTLNQNTTGTASNVTGTVAVANGGTGLITTPANGALDIGNGTGFTRTTLTAGTNVTITNASGAITINSSNPGGTVTAVSVASANGFAGTSSGGATPALTLSTTITGVLKGNGTAISAATSGTDYSAGTSALTTGILKSTTTTGALSIAVAGDFPTLNQNTTGSAATLTTPRAIYGNNFDGSAALAQIIASTYGGTGNGFTKFSGATTAEKTYLLPDASTTILTTNAAVTIAQGGTGQTTQQAALTALSGTQTSGQYLRSNGTNTLLSAIQVADVPTLNQNTTGTASNVTGVVAIANGGTGQTTQQAALTALSGTQTSGQYLRSNGTNTLLSAIQAADVPTLNQNTTGSAATLTTGRTIAITGDLAYTSPSFNGSANVTAAGTLATVNANVGSFTNATLTVNGKGLITAASSGTAPVTSVTGTSPVVSSGGATPAISLASGYGDTQNPYASKTANFVLAAPNGVAGVPTFRAVVAADIPTLNQNTTGSAATLTTGRTIAITGDLAYTSGSFNGSANVTGAGTLATVNANVGSFTYATLTVNGKGLITAASSGTAPVTSVTATSPVASTGGATPVISMPAATTSVSGYLTSTDWTTFNSKGSGTVTAVSVASANGFAGTSSGGATPALTLSTTITGVLKGNATAISAATSGTDYSAGTSALTTGILKSTTTTGALSIAVAADFPTLNQNTTGTASNVTGTVAIANGGSGQTTAQTAMNAFAGSVTSGFYLRGNGTNVVMSAIQAADVPTLNQNTTGTASNVTGVVAIANGGTGQTTATLGFNALAPSQTSNSGKYLTTDGTNTSWATVASSSNTTAFAFAWFIR